MKIPEGGPIVPSGRKKLSTSLALFQLSMFYYLLPADVKKDVI